MSVTSVDRDYDNLTITLIADFDAPIDQVWVSTVMVQLTERGGATRMAMQSGFESREDMEKWVSMGTVEGLQQAVGQMDALLG